MKIDLNFIITSLAGVAASLTAIAIFAKKIKDWVFRDIYISLKDLRLISKRNELLLLYNNQPKSIEVIDKAYDEYMKLGGNSYVTSLHREWQKKYAKDILEKYI